VQAARGREEGDWQAGGSVWHALDMRRCGAGSGARTLFLRSVTRVFGRMFEAFGGVLLLNRWKVAESTANSDRRRRVPC
jgi:hypothetical protein